MEDYKEIKRKNLLKKGWYNVMSHTQQSVDIKKAANDYLSYMRQYTARVDNVMKQKEKQNDTK